MLLYQGELLLDIISKIRYTANRVRYLFRNTHPDSLNPFFPGTEILGNMANEAYWLTGVGEQPKIGPADSYEPGEGEILIQVRLTYDTFTERILRKYTD